MTYLRQANRTSQFKFVIQHYHTTIPHVAVCLDPGISLDIEELHVTFSTNDESFPFPLHSPAFLTEQIGTLNIHASRAYTGYQAFRPFAYATRHPDRRIAVPLPIFECFFYLQEYIRAH